MIESKEIKYIYSLIKGDKLININNFIQKEDFNSYIEFKDEQEITGIFMPLINIFTKETAPVLITALRKYTGASFKDINAILRNNWDNEIPQAPYNPDLQLVTIYSSVHSSRSHHHPGS